MDRRAFLKGAAAAAGVALTAIPLPILPPTPATTVIPFMPRDSFSAYIQLLEFAIKEVEGITGLTPMMLGVR